MTFKKWKDMLNDPKYPIEDRMFILIASVALMAIAMALGIRIVIGASKLELLIKMLRKKIKEYGKTNRMAAKRFQEMLEETIKLYHERRKHLTAEEAGEAQEATSEEIIRNATEQALQILREMNADRESFRKIGLTFEEKAFYDILLALRDQYNFEYGEDKLVGGVSVNEKCKTLAKKGEGDYRHEIILCRLAEQSDRPGSAEI